MARYMIYSLSSTFHAFSRVRLTTSDHPDYHECGAYVQANIAETSLALAGTRSGVPVRGNHRETEDGPPETNLIVNPIIVV